jgi:phosphoserine phosphatase
MNTILTLIGKPGALTAEHIAVARDTLGEAGLITRTDADWLEPGEACDIALSDQPAPELCAKLEEALAPAAIDAVLQPAEHRKKRLLIADMDSTIITCECIDELADAMGIKDKVAAITERAMRGEIQFEPALEERVALLKGLPVTALEKVFEERIRLSPGARALVATMTANGATALLVSGGFTFFTARVCELAGFSRHQGNILEIEDGKLTGRVVPPILGRDAKLEALVSEAAALGVPLEASLAVGDGANDLEMVKAAGLGIAYHAKPIVAAAAPAAIRHGDLSALLFVQGYRRQDFIA